MSVVQGSYSENMGSMSRAQALAFVEEKIRQVDSERSRANHVLTQLSSLTDVHPMRDSFMVYYQSLVEKGTMWHGIRERLQAECDANHQAP